jgi:DNA-binding beta-propeller fold protein YncE
MQAAFPPGFAAARTPPSVKRRREPEELELEESRCGRYRPAGLDARVSSVVLPALGCIRALAVGSDGTVFACTDSALYAMPPAGQISMIAGSRSEMGHRDGTHSQKSKRHNDFIWSIQQGTDFRAFAPGLGPEARFNKPCGLAVHTDGSLVVADTFNHCLRRVTADGAVSTFAGSGVGGLADAMGTAARFQHPWGLTIDAQGIIYVSDHGNHCIRRVTPADGAVITISGSRTGQRGLADGDTAAARFNEPSGLALDMHGLLVVADTGNSCVRRVMPVDGRVMTVAGSLAGGDHGEGFADGVGSHAHFRYPFGVAVDRNNAIIVADGHNHRYRERKRERERGCACVLHTHPTTGYA